MHKSGATLDLSTGLWEFGFFLLEPDSGNDTIVPVTDEPSAYIKPLATVDNETVVMQTAQMWNV